MAHLSLSLPVFVASPAEVKPEREAAEQVILGAARDAAKAGLLLYPFLWEVDHYPAAGPAQPPLTDQLLRAELVVAIFWTRVGVGSLVELEAALTQARYGMTDNVAIYFKTAPAPGRDDGEVRLLRDSLIKQDRALTWDFATTEEFRHLFDQHLRTWLRRWEGVPACCDYATANSTAVRGTGHVGDNRLARLARGFDLNTLDRVRGYLGSEAVARYQRSGLDALRQTLSRRTLLVLDPDWESAAVPLPEAQRQAQQAAQVGLPFICPRPLLTTAAGEVFYADGEWFSYFCAAGLAEALCEGRLEAVSTRPYLNSIHQFLSALVRRDERPVTKTLIGWLTNEGGRTGTRPVARNFAAYVLGMINAIEAQEALAQAMHNDRGEDVATYCITSLGKLRARTYLPRLVEMFQHERDDRLRLILSQAVATMVGVARFDL
jgi:hypothetical protein